jgi:hypothetical protein
MQQTKIYGKNKLSERITFIIFLSMFSLASTSLGILRANPPTVRCLLYAKLPIANKKYITTWVSTSIQGETLSQYNSIS